VVVVAILNRSECNVRKALVRQIDINKRGKL
jgi:hypothetical protein